MIDYYLLLITYTLRCSKILLNPTTLLTEFMNFL